MRSNLELLQLIKKSYDDMPDLKLLSGLCTVMIRLDYKNIFEAGEYAKIFEYLQKKFKSSTSSYWWPPYDWQVRYDAICDCIQEEEKNIDWVSEFKELEDRFKEESPYCVCERPVIAPPNTRRVAAKKTMVCGVCGKPLHEKFQHTKKEDRNE